ncbi:hypothetical protein [Prevotella denticola]|uniref:hypothetical protein n=1 Tax=Prevotella denticola TaxID=28129 RepID=UPI001BAB5AF9|nr:hypothetical protein [Prevotella denticola]QUB89880.1 hypothetical protein J4855_06260 [Prevotella denticola]
MKVSGQRSAAPMGSEHRCRKAEALCARLSEKDAKNEDTGQTALKRLQKKKEEAGKGKRKVAGGKSMTKRRE